MLKYIDLKYEPKRSDVVCEFYIKPNRIPIEKAANHVAGESSIDTWSDIKTLSPTIVNRLMPHVFSINKNTGEVKIAYSSDLFEAGNMTQILSSIAGNIFGMKAIKALRLQDITFPKKMVKSFPGPRLGIKGVRKLLAIKKRPLCGTIVKPKLGLTARQHAQVAYEAWVGGLDCVKDDENLTSMVFNKFKDRIALTLKMKEKAEIETGERKAYMPNVSAELIEMLKRMDHVKNHNGNYIMADILTVGFSAMQTLRKRSILPIHGHRAMHAAITKNPYHGISMLVLAKISRLIGVDTLHIGTANLGKMGGKFDEGTEIEDEIEKALIVENPKSHVLGQKWYNIKPCLAVASGGLHPGHVQELIKRMGKNILCQFGGGVHAHPQGTRAGAKAVRQAIDAVEAKMSLKEYAKNHQELALAIKAWGVA